MPSKKGEQKRANAFSYNPDRHGFLRRGAGRSTLYCDGIALPELARQYGTPLYVYSASVIRERVKAFDRAFKNVPHTVCYSVKANSNLSILRLLSSINYGFNVVSNNE